MAKPVLMPRIGQSVESSIIANWYKKVGDSVTVGDRLFTFETDKATFDEEAKTSGILLAKFYEEGDDVPCMKPVAVIGQNGESYAEFAPGSTLSPADDTSVQSDPEVAALTRSVVSTIDDFVKISPRARKLAEKNKVEYRIATPTGAEGRIIKKDVQDLIDSDFKFTSAALKTAKTVDSLTGIQGSGLGGRITVQDVAVRSAQAASQPTSISGMEFAYEDVKLTNIRKVIARTMQQSLATMAQLTHHSSFDATVVEKFRQETKNQGEKIGLGKITLNDIILFAVSRTLPAHRSLNAHFIEDKMRYFHDVNLGMAVDTERGLMVPTIFEANRKSLGEIARETKELVLQCQNGSINPDLLTGATFTVSNLGATGIEIFTPIINPPQTGILGICSMLEKPRPAIVGGIEFFPSVGLSLTYDHRAIDGAPASRFLQDLIKNLECFTMLLAK